MACCRKGHFVITLLVILVLYSSMDWINFLLFPPDKSLDEYARNATSSLSAPANHHDGHGTSLPLRSGAGMTAAFASLSQRWNVSSATSVTLGLRNATLPSPVIAGDGESSTSTYIPLPLPNASAPPISFGGCCGIGHRLGRNLKTMVYAISHSRPLHADWDDVEWGALFNDTANIKRGPAAQEEYRNDVPLKWNASSLAWHDPLVPNFEGRSTAYHRYSEDDHILFEMPLAHSIVKSLSDNLSPLVLSFLEPMREQYKESDLHLCLHVREGNNETGDWERKKWRHIDLNRTLNTTLVSMRSLAEKKNATSVSVFVASDTARARPLFEKSMPPSWNVVRPAKELPRPEKGVWFGELTSPTNAVLSKDKRDEAMAEAVADMFALGECDALFIPNYSSFTTVSIMLARAERRKVLFLWWQEFLEYL